MDNKPVLWDKNTNNLQSTLRQPKGSPNVLSKNPTQSSTSPGPRVEINKTAIPGNAPSNSLSIEEMVANSNLNTEAPEWYPSGHATNFVPDNVDGITKSIQNRLKIHKKNESDGFSNTNDHSMIFPSMSEDDYSPDIRRLKQIITTLTKDPGQFHNLLDLFLDTLAPYFNDIMALSTVAKILVEQAINNANFRYTGARLCWNIEQNCPEFRAELHLRCKKQIEDNSNTQNVLLFIAELYTQLPHMTVYGALLIDTFKRLFEKGGDDNIKCICQALKLTGYMLEQSNKIDLDEIFHKLNALKDSTGGSAAILLQTVLSLRLSNWGHSSEGSESDQESDGFMYGDEQSPIFINAEGEALTTEESEFMAAHMNSNDDILSDTSDPDELCDPEPEMDEEIQEAFREFVKFSSKH
ncbi:hypothetical protein JTB14_006587 [Gonioctena quinquepunctata]|nr:hypothetical protein JTB14_006587 [Gonioctena quinquepunctata]